MIFFEEVLRASVADSLDDQEFLAIFTTQTFTYIFTNILTIFLAKGKTP